MMYEYTRMLEKIDEIDVRKVANPARLELSEAGFACLFL